MMAESTKDHIEKFMRKGILISPDLLTTYIPEEKLENLPTELVVANKDNLNLIEKKQQVNWPQLDRLRSLNERGKNAGYEAYVQCLESPAPQSFDDGQPQTSSSATDYFTNVEIAFSYDKESRVFDQQDFVRYFNQRYHQIEKLLRIRPELHSTISISRVLKKNEKENITIIGMVIDKSETKNGNLMISVEDPTGKINILVSKNKPELFQAARDIVPDEVIGIVGVCGSNIIFANNIYWPDVPFNKELRKAPDDVYAIFLSDIHVGSKNFLMKEFMRFLKWINGKSGTDEQRDIASKVRYIFMIGDLVDGVGIYLDQEKELSFPDIYGQYNEFSRLINMIPHHIKVIVCPGNHDALRLSEPQPKLDPDFARSVYELPHVTIVSNPSVVNIHKKNDFEGIDVLMYHGYSFDYYVANVDSIRSKGGYHRADLIIKFLLKRRHIAPSHESTLHIPDTETDPLVITHVPDIFATGHIHYSLVANYRNVTMISGSCWQGMTSFQEKLGHKPEPARIPIINLKTRQAKILKFA